MGQRAHDTFIWRAEAEPGPATVRPPIAAKEVILLALTILGVSIAGREVLIIAGVIAIIVAVAGFLIQQRGPR
jgi:hypothetical protein